MCVCGHIYIYMCVCVCVCMCVHIYLCVHAHTHTHTHIYIYIERERERERAYFYFLCFFLCITRFITRVCMRGKLLIFKQFFPTSIWLFSVHKVIYFFLTSFTFPSVFPALLPLHHIATTAFSFTLYHNSWFFPPYKPSQSPPTPQHSFLHQYTRFLSLSLSSSPLFLTLSLSFSLSITPFQNRFSPSPSLPSFSISTQSVISCYHRGLSPLLNPLPLPIAGTGSANNGEGAFFFFCYYC